MYLYSSYDDLFRRYGSQQQTADITAHIYLHHPSMLTTTADVEYWDKATAQDITALLNLAELLKEHRQHLAERYGQLSTMAYTRKLTIRRYRRYKGTITYYVTITRTMEDGTQIEELSETYSGTERRKAMNRFADLKKQYPGIDTEEDLEKSPWEK